MKKQIIYPLVLGLLAIGSCKLTDEPKPNDQDPNAPSNLGYTPSDDMSTVPTSTHVSFGNSNLPAVVDLVPLFPPIGNQESYGTCVAWAVAYNMKTAIEGIEKNLSTQQLASPNNQLSPRDLFTAIPNDKKGQDCNGTNFGFALDVVQQRGIATMQTVPYNNLGNCTSSGVQTNWTSEAAGHKIKSYRKIAADVNTIKEYIYKKIPVVFGARLADNFMTWNSDNVLTSNTSFDQVGIHAYHAMVIGGYDNSKGPGGAFKVINSWGGSWGSAGYIWVDYNFFVNTFCDGGNGEKPLFIAENGASDNTPPNDNPTSTGVDLAPWIFEDYNYDGFTGRLMSFNLYNIGNQPAGSNANWELYYIYYNAYNANDFGIVTADQFNTSIAANTIYQVNSNQAIFNYNIPAGGDLASLVFGTQYMQRLYYMPQNLTGYYYLVMVADVTNKFEEGNEQNNLFYTTSAPKYFQYGASSKGVKNDNAFSFKNADKSTPSDNTIFKSPYKTTVTRTNPNAYRPDEIINFLKAKHKTGELKQKIEAYKNTTQEKGGFINRK
ncbi:MAG TPA: C1 family peptidase [Flavipsychrobacter sp.]|nr:C1 family peptidase [Flavipsychrobacter sp.]